jgi:DNA-binding response OmpR family regulator
MNTVRKPLVLVAEDDEDCRALVVFRLQMAGCDVVAAKDGEEALRLTAERSPDLVVLDVMMPKRTGFEVVEALRHDDATRRTPVIFLTARVQEQDVERGFALGANDFVKKPFSPTELEARVNAILGRR